MRWFVVFFWASWLHTSVVCAWDPFLVENQDVAAGNDDLVNDRAPQALARYDRAVRQLPSEPRVHLNRGLALLETDELDRAEEAFSRATEAGVPADVRADAYYNLGIALYRQADAAAGEENHEEAQRQFREAADAFRSALRMRPGNADAGWNLELALRRIREEEEAQEQQEQDQENEDEQEQDQENEDEQEQDQENEDEQEQDQENEDEQEQDQENEDEQEQDQENEDEQEQDQENEGEQEQDQENEDEQEQDSQAEQEQDSQDQPEQDRQEESETEPNEGSDERAIPPESQRILDALQDQEESLERQRARARAARERRRVTRDW